MQTRSEYMALLYVDQETATARHRAYYAQFITPGLLAAVVNRIGAQRIEQSINRDGCFNDIPLIEWDRMQPLVLSYAGQLLRIANGSGGTSLSDAVCIAKECAKQWREAFDNGKMGV